MTLYPPGAGQRRLLIQHRAFGGDQLDYQLQHTGLYTIVIRDAGLNEAGNYNITLLKIPGVVSSEADPDGGPIASGQTLSGTINAISDLDAFQFYGQAGERVIINAVTTSGTLTRRFDSLPSGSGAAEASLSVIWDQFGGDQIDYQLQHTGLYTIVIRDTGLHKLAVYHILSKIPATPAPGIYNPAPANGTTIYNINGAFRWNGVSGATGYDIYFGSDPTQPPQKIGDNLASPSMAFPALTRGKVYFWQVVAHTPQGDIQGPYCWFLVSTKTSRGLPWLPLLLLE